MKRTQVFILLAILSVALDARPTYAEGIYRANPTPPTNGRVGANYTAAYAVNQIQFWHDFQSKVIDRELAAAQQYFGISTLRVYLHCINFEQEKDVFLANIETFLTICDRYEIKPGFVFFDDCHRADGIFLDKPTTPIKGYHNGRWAWSPQKRHRDPNNLERFKPYVQDVIQRHRTDKRVLFWEIFNEPNLRNEFSMRLRELGYAWAKEVGPVQPLINCWDDNEVTDIVDAHNYVWVSERWDRQADLNPKKGTVLTEAGTRWYAPRKSNGEPCEIMHWLENRRSKRQSTPGVYLCWELMVGNSNCRWYWGTPEGASEPTVPWCGLMWPDSTPVSLAEAESIKRYTTGKKQALLFDDFQSVEPLARPGWSAYGKSESGVLKLSPNMKMIAGDPEWTDYVIEAKVMLKEERGNTGLVFRVNNPGEGVDQMAGYYVGFDPSKLYLGKMNNNFKKLAEYDIKQLDCKVIPGVWNQIRVAARGNRIKVWLNRMHPSADPEKGLRIDIKDEKSPILSGNIGLRTYGTDAWFDNIVVLPVDDPITNNGNAGRWSRERANQWYSQQAWPCGFNYVPANAISYTEMWMPYCFDAELIGKELDLAQGVGFNCLRVVLPFVVWEHDPKEFKKRLNKFLDVCDKRSIKVMFTLFDDCGELKDPQYGKQSDVIKGWYANAWSASPGHSMVGDPKTWPRLEKYVKDIITSFKDDPRVWVWDLYNEPTNSGMGDTSLPLVTKVFEWARAIGPSGPLTVARWNGNKKLNAIIYDNSDIITFHGYGNSKTIADIIKPLKSHGRPIINTEWLNRPGGSLVETCLPILPKKTSAAYNRGW